MMVTAMETKKASVNNGNIPSMVVPAAIATGIKRDSVDVAVRTHAVASMAHLNAGAALAMREVGVSAATDVTGFGLLGHLAEMLGDAIGVAVDAAAVPLLPGAVEMATDGVVP